VILNEFNNAPPELLAVFLFIHEEGLSNEVFLRIEDGRRRWCLCSNLISGVLANVDLSMGDLSLRGPT
jgi:hypothetical protein